MQSLTQVTSAFPALAEPLQTGFQDGPVDVGAFPGSPPPSSSLSAAALPPLEIGPEALTDGSLEADELVYPPADLVEVDPFAGEAGWLPVDPLTGLPAQEGEAYVGEPSLEGDPIPWDGGLVEESWLVAAVMTWVSVTPSLTFLTLEVDPTLPADDAAVDQGDSVATGDASAIDPWIPAVAEPEAVLPLDPGPFTDPIHCDGGLPGPEGWVDSTTPVDPLAEFFPEEPLGWMPEPQAGMKEPEDGMEQWVDDPGITLFPWLEDGDAVDDGMAEVVDGELGEVVDGGLIVDDPMVDLWSGVPLGSDGGDPSSESGIWEEGIDPRLMICVMPAPVEGPFPESFPGITIDPADSEDPQAGVSVDPVSLPVKGRPLVPMPWWRGAEVVAPEPGDDSVTLDASLPTFIKELPPEADASSGEEVDAAVGVEREPVLTAEDDFSEDPGFDLQIVEHRPLVPMPWWRGAEVVAPEPGDDSVTLDASLPTFIKELPPEADASSSEEVDPDVAEVAVCWFGLPSPSVLELSEPDPIAAEGADDSGLGDLGSSGPESWNVPAVVIDPMPEFLVDEPLGSHDEAGVPQLWATDFAIKMTVMVVDGSPDTQSVPDSLLQQEDPMIFGDVPSLAFEAPGEDVPFVLDSGLGMDEDPVLSSAEPQPEETPGAASDPFIPMPWWRAFTSRPVAFEPVALSQDTPSGDESADIAIDADEMVADVQDDGGPLDGPVLIDEAGPSDESLLLDGPRVGFFDVLALDAPSEAAVSVAELAAGLEPMTAAEPDATSAPVDPDPLPAQSMVAAIAAARAPLPAAPDAASSQPDEPVAAEPDPVGNRSAATRAAGLSGPIASPVISEAVTPPLAPPPPTATQDVAGDLSGLSPEDPGADALAKLLSLCAIGSIGVEAPATWRDLDPDTLRLAASNRSL